MAFHQRYEEQKSTIGTTDSTKRSKLFSNEDYGGIYAKSSPASRDSTIRERISGQFKSRSSGKLFVSKLLKKAICESYKRGFEPQCYSSEERDEKVARAYEILHEISSGKITLDKEVIREVEQEVIWVQKPNLEKDAGFFCEIDYARSSEVVYWPPNLLLASDTEAIRYPLSFLFGCN